jgi:hypothetical protein
LLLKVETNLAGFLGTLLEAQDGGSIELKQIGLIECITRAVGLKACDPRWAPVELMPPAKGAGSPLCVKKWSCASVVELATKWIVKRLAGAKIPGLQIEPKGSLKLDLHVDADFAGLWNSEDPNDASGTCTQN